MTTFHYLGEHEVRRTVEIDTAPGATLPIARIETSDHQGSVPSWNGNVDAHSWATVSCGARNRPGQPEIVEVDEEGLAAKQTLEVREARWESDSR